MGCSLDNANSPIVSCHVYGFRNIKYDGTSTVRYMCGVHSVGRCVKQATIVEVGAKG